MSVFGGVMLFTGGVVLGGGAVLFNHSCVKRQTAQLRRENEHLKESAWHDRLEYETHRAYGEGYRDGRNSPASDAEKFADFVERRNIDFRGRQRKRYGGEGEGAERA